MYFDRLPKFHTFMHKKIIHFIIKRRLIKYLYDKSFFKKCFTTKTILGTRILTCLFFVNFKNFLKTRLTFR